MVASSIVFVCLIFQRWMIVGITIFIRQWAAFIETTSREWIDRFTDTAFDLHALPFISWIWYRNRGKQSFRVRVLRIMEQFFRFTDLDNLP